MDRKHYGESGPPSYEDATGAFANRVATSVGKREQQQEAVENRIIQNLMLRAILPFLDSMASSGLKEAVLVLIPHDTPGQPHFDHPKARRLGHDRILGFAEFENLHTARLDSEDDAWFWKSSRALNSIRQQTLDAVADRDIQSARVTQQAPTNGGKKHWWQLKSSENGVPEAAEPRQPHPLVNVNYEEVDMHSQANSGMGMTSIQQVLSLAIRVKVNI